MAANHLTFYLNTLQTIAAPAYNTAKFQLEELDTDLFMLFDEKTQQLSQPVEASHLTLVDIEEYISTFLQQADACL
jgi:hypothetical protein